ncbi:hypothetical protein BB559_002894 [Furculomyces boomerangus]|uniref:DUF1014 domain-containing protein n=2 Tax=Harpellales TaxID=61421 RepID=A0A2T9YR99_9FUNG|nr:hypothetical protein BB559_002894 [Furculomyces boomerangus]PVZ97801.1 hypothetical protein BB558_006229 [Smittium angustum]PVZ98821.1 hypothetical protein BB558_005171 [Smittium angustum]PVZ99761.1 hypothetical protein BB558_004209 [Smittium angustum]
MPKKFKGENTKVSAAKEKKSLVQEEKTKKKAAEMEKKEAEIWSVGSKKTNKKDSEEAKKLEKAEKKKQLEELLKKEEQELLKSAPKKQPAKLFPTVNKPVARGTEKKAVAKEEKIVLESQTAIPIESYGASGIDNALDLFDTLKIDSTSPGSGPVRIDKGSAISNLIDRHPERRHKAALKAYEDRELPILKEKYKGLRLQQLKQILWKEWQKSPENPFNQSQVTHNATQEEVSKVVGEHTEAIKSRLAID